MLYQTTMIHGRFQPFHIGHFDYFKKALELTRENLIIGITNPTPELIVEEDASEHRHKKESNPFSFFLRQQMIREAILHDDMTRKYFEKIMIVPFPIHHPQYWDYFFPKNAVQVLCLIEEWSHVKKTRFVNLGYNVHILDACRLTSGTYVRFALREGKNIENLVPKGTLNVLQSVDVQSIIKSYEAEQSAAPDRYSAALHSGR